MCISISVRCAITTTHYRVGTAKRTAFQLLDLNGDVYLPHVKNRLFYWRRLCCLIPVSFESIVSMWLLPACSSFTPPVTLPKRFPCCESVHRRKSLQVFDRVFKFMRTALWNTQWLPLCLFSWLSLSWRLVQLCRPAVRISTWRILTALMRCFNCSDDVRLHCDSWQMSFSDDMPRAFVQSRQSAQWIP